MVRLAAGAAGSLAGLGLFLVACGLRGTARTGPRPTRRRGSGRWPAQVALAVATGLGVLVVTSWPVGAALAGGLASRLPGAFGGRAARARDLARVEAVATWAGQLRDMLVAGSGIMETIEVTAPLAPRPIREEVGLLALRMRRGQLVPALRRFAADVDDPTAHLVAGALIAASTEHVGHLGDLLGTLAGRTREQAAMRCRVEADRRPVRTQARLIMVTTLVCVLGLFAFDRPLVAAYDSPAGQGVLALVGGCFLGAFALLARMGRLERPAGFVLAEVER
jgi:hypothetical protein